MKIIVTSDYHGNVKPAEKIRELTISEKFDCIVICGDISSHWMLETAKKIMKTLVEADVPVLYVPGNMDPLKIVDALKDLGTNLHNRKVTIKDVCFVGAGFEENLEDVLSSALNSLGTFKTLIVVTHIPPYNCKVDVTWNGNHIGDPAVRVIVERFKPKAVLCGHVHESPGVDYIGETVICNPGPVYKGHYAEVKIKDGEIKVNLCKFKG
ncbi:MAG: metallophosphoesterase [Candidatus Bathyarchaeota archaeon]|nr:metallophosphoesterase [Candidatus Bathyarchaeota archaeon]